MTQSDDDNRIDREALHLVGAVLKEVTRGEAELIDLKIAVLHPGPIEVKENNVTFGDDKYDDVSPAKIPKKSDLEISLKVKHTNTGREVASVTQTNSTDRSVNHVGTTEVTGFGNLPGEVEKNKTIKKDAADEIKKWALEIVNIIISILNAIRRFRYGFFG